MATKIWVNIGSGNGLLPDGTEPLPEPMLTYHYSAIYVCDIGDIYCTIKYCSAISFMIIGLTPLYHTQECIYK